MFMVRSLIAHNFCENSQENLVSAGTFRRLGTFWRVLRLIVHTGLSADIRRWCDAKFRVGARDTSFQVMEIPIPFHHVSGVGLAPSDSFGATVNSRIRCCALSRQRLDFTVGLQFFAVCSRDSYALSSVFLDDEKSTDLVGCSNWNVYVYYNHKRCRCACHFVGQQSNRTGCQRRSCSRGFSYSLLFLQLTARSRSDLCLRGLSARTYRFHRLWTTDC